jgi:hypothetical protein
LAFSSTAKLAFGQDHALLGHLRLKPFEALLHRLKIVALPHPAHASRRDRVALLAHLVRHPDLAKGGLLQGQRDDSRLDLGRSAVRQQGLAAG